MSEEQLAKPGCFKPQIKTPFKITWASWKERRYSYCATEAEMWHDFYHLICNAFNNCRAYINEKLVKEDPPHGWNIVCPICKEAREFVGKESEAREKR